MMRVTRWAAVVALLLATTLHAPGVAHAQHGDGGLEPDNATQYVRRINLTTFGSSAALHGDAQIERSVINTFDGSDDIDVYDYTYGQTGWYGVTDCVDWVVLLGPCDVMRIRLNESLIPGGLTYWKKVGCHEFGHTGDLGHRTSSDDTNNDSCMRTGSDGGWPQQLDSHDINAINNGF